MPTLYTVSDEKKTPDLPVIITQVEPTPPKRRSIKKYVIVSVSILLAAAIILAAILVGMYFFTQKEIIRYSLEFNKNANQDVTSDPNTNIVQYQIQNPGRKAWIVNDFNRDIQVVKIQTDTQTNCYVSALNRTRAKEPSQITGPETKEVNKAATLTYVTSGTPISDTSFLAKAARDMCRGFSTYWLYPQCTDNSNMPMSTRAPPSYQSSTMMMPNAPGATRQAPVDNSPWYIYWSYPHNANVSVFCVTGCCKTVCACSIDYYWYYSSNSLYCTWVASSCPDYGIRENPVSQSCTDGPAGLDCPNVAPAALPTC